jgi:hypothetical protein
VALGVIVLGIAEAKINNRCGIVVIGASFGFSGIYPQAGIAHGDNIAFAETQTFDWFIINKCLIGTIQINYPESIGFNIEAAMLT